MGCDIDHMTDEERIAVNRAIYQSEQDRREKDRQTQEQIKEFIRKEFADHVYFTLSDVRDKLEIHYEENEKLTRAQRRAKLEELDLNVRSAFFNMQSKESQELVSVYSEKIGTVRWNKKPTPK
jgi:hypothetical protein